MIYKYHIAEAENILIRDVSLEFGKYHALRYIDIKHVYSLQCTHAIGNNNLFWHAKSI